MWCYFFFQCSKGVITQFQIASYFDKIYTQINSVKQPKKSFKFYIIRPFDDKLFTDDDFAPGDVTDRPYLTLLLDSSRLSEWKMSSSKETNEIVS